jgi:hypothetical protein
MPWICTSFQVTQILSIKTNLLSLCVRIPHCCHFVDTFQYFPLSTIKHMIESEKTTIAKSDAVSDGIDTFFRVVTVINTFTVMLQKNFYLHIVC